MEVLDKSNILTDADKAKVSELLNKECNLQMSAPLMEEFLSLGTVRNLRRRECIIEEGAVNDDVYVIIDGIMRIWYNNGEQEVTQAFGLAGTLFMAFHCYYNAEPSSVNFEACTPVRVLHIKHKDFDDLIERNPEFARWNLRMLQYQLYHYEIKNRVIKGSARERYESYLGHRPEIVNNVPLKVIATYLGVTPEYLSKLRRQIVTQ